MLRNGYQLIPQSNQPIKQELCVFTQIQFPSSARHTGKIIFDIFLKLVRTLGLAMAKLLVTQPFNCCYKTLVFLTRLLFLVFLNHTNLGGCVFQKVKLQADGASIGLNRRVAPWRTAALENRPYPGYTHEQDTRFCFTITGILWVICIAWPTLTICGSVGTCAHGWPESLGQKGGDKTYVCCIRSPTDLRSTRAEEKVH